MGTSSKRIFWVFLHWVHRDGGKDVEISHVDLVDFCFCCPVTIPFLHYYFFNIINQPPFNNIE